MNHPGFYISYSIAVFIIVLLSANVVNLLKQHYVFQLTGIAFFFTVFTVRCGMAFEGDPDHAIPSLLLTSLPLFSGICACLISMVLGFCVFPVIRKRMKD